MATEQRNIVIIGGGIIGCTTAYYLTRHPSFNPTLHTLTLLEATSIASGASGKAGGLLATWAYPPSIVPLSFKLHAELAREHNGAKRWGYRRLHVGSLSAKGRLPLSGANESSGRQKGEEWNKLPKIVGEGEKYGAKGKKKGIPDDLNWFDSESITEYSEMGTPETTAQVHPYQFTTSMADLAVAAGAKIIFGSVTAIDYLEGKVKGVAYEEKETKDIHTLEATDVVLAAGPWTSHIFPKAPIEAIRAHSVVVKADVSPYAIFSEIELPKGFPGMDGVKGKRRYAGIVHPELYARPDGTVYACGEGDSLVPLPKSSDLVICDEERCQEIVDYISSVSTPMRKGTVLAKQACYLPSVAGGVGPLIGRTGIKGLFMATGHTCWGIQNSCATGKLISEYIFDGDAKSASIHSLDPRRAIQ